MANDVQGGSTADRGAPPSPAKAAAAVVAKNTATTPHQSFMTVLGQVAGVTLLVEFAGYSPAAGRVVAVMIVGLWLAFLVNNSAALFGALTVKRT